jgi:hypothetical protein
VATASKTGKATKKASGRVTPKKRSGAADFKKGRTEVDLTLPSGHVVLAKRRGMDHFLEAGVVPNSLMAIIQDQIDTAEDKPKKDLKKELEKMAGDQQRMADIVLLANNVVAECVLEPTVRLHTWTAQDVLEGIVEGDQVGKDIPGSERDEDIVYTDEVDMEDKFFIFTWAVGGTSNVERFRAERNAVLVDVPAGEGVGD